jgi:hypothetical protein
VIVLRVIGGIGGALLVFLTAMSAVKTFVLPRGEPTRLSRVVFISVRILFNMRMRSMDDFYDRDHLFALYAPVSLLVLPLAWLISVGTGFAVLYWAFGTESFWAAVQKSGSALFTLGTIHPTGVGQTLMTFAEAGLGLGLLAVLIAYLPAMYGAFQRRELVVTLLDVRANTPPTAKRMIERYYVIHGLDQLQLLWPQWEEWFADIEESHTSLGAMSFFRSPHPDRSWITAAGAVLDAASFVVSSVDIERTPSAQVCVRAGYVALRGIADLFDVPFDPDPPADAPISVTRDEFDVMWDHLAGVGVPLKPDRDQAWRDFRGWRVNYDQPLIGLCGLLMAPPAPWSSDRALPFRRPRVRWRRRRSAPAGAAVSP